MTESLTLPELQHIMAVLNASDDPDCPICSSVRQKLEKVIEIRKVEKDRSMGIAGRDFEHVGGPGS